VRFEPGFGQRLEALGSRLALARERREGGGVPSLSGGGAEFVGYRPYARGDDLRALDWDLWARSRRPWVRVSRREAGERWLVRLDASASMGVGPPGKLQRAAEVAAGIAFLGARAGSDVRVSVAEGPRPHSIVVRRRGQIAGLLAFLESLSARGASGPRPTRPELAQIARVFLVGDLADLRPEAALSLRSPGRAVSVIHLLAPIEIAPPASGAVEWWDPENGARIALALDSAVRDAYEAELEGEIGTWRALAARRGVAYGCFSTATPFEEILERSGAA
jgi:uncharacterized protein (DUF58 family)